MNDFEDEMARTPDVINLSEVTANEEEQSKKEGRRRELNFEQFDVSTKEGFKELMRFQMRIFEHNYDFENDELVGGVAEY